MSRPSDETLSSIIGDIYDCALSPEGWTGVMTRITSAIDAAYTTIALTSISDSRGRFAARSPWDAERMRALQDYELSEIPGLREAVMGDIDQPLRTLAVISEAELARSAFFLEWAAPRDYARAVRRNLSIQPTGSGCSAPRHGRTGHRSAPSSSGSWLCFRRICAAPR
uniref:hypothetical protein n=1 Tax=Neorhizobium sp. EC2-8 TaxID=3129230 RepID=UPI003100E4B8